MEGHSPPDDNAFPSLELSEISFVIGTVGWPEISSGILEPGQKPADRADIVIRVYNMKLEEMLEKIKTGQAFGPVLAGTFCAS